MAGADGLTTTPSSMMIYLRQKEKISVCLAFDSKLQSGPRAKSKGSTIELEFCGTYLLLTLAVTEYLHQKEKFGTYHGPLQQTSLKSEILAYFLLLMLVYHHMMAHTH